MPLARRTEKWWGSVMEVGLDPELTKWSVRSGSAIVLTGKGYKERHWWDVSLINHFSYFHFHTITSHSQHADVRLYYSRDPGPVRQGPCRCSSSWSNREPH